MKIVLSGGGTAGHIYPALALAGELANRGHEVSFVGTPQGLEARLVPEAGIDFTPIPAAGFDRSRPWTLITSTLQVLRSALGLRGYFKQHKPDAVVGFGGYVSIPVGLAASWEGIPLTIHEQNSIPGMTNRFLARRARQVCVTYPETESIFKGLTRGQVHLTGNPVRSQILEATRVSGRASLGIPEDAVLLLIFGGSRGARHINQRMVELASTLLDLDDVYVIHATGEGEFAATSAALDQTIPPTSRYQVVPYLHDMGSALAACDIALCRAGATTIAELTALGIPSVLVPYPYATDDHQTKNALAMDAHGAARLVSDQDLDSDGFATMLTALLEDGSVRASMAQAAKELSRVNAAVLLADAVESSVR